jgi:hypothetical protein
MKSAARMELWLRLARQTDLVFFEVATPLLPRMVRWKDVFAKIQVRYAAADVKGWRQRNMICIITERFA